MEEIWKDIPGYEGYYQASNLGRIKRIAFLHGKSKMIIKKEKILKPINNKNGYYYIGLSRYKVKQYRLHRIILSTFMPIKNDYKMQVNHKNGNKHDNRLENLEWVSASENIKHAFNSGLKHGLRNKYNKLSKKVIQYDLLGKKIKIWESTKQIERELGINNVSISQCCLGKIKKSHNYIWRYCND